MISLSRRISIGTVLVTSVVVGIAVILVWWIARWQSFDVLDGELAEHAARLPFLAGHPRPPPDSEDGPGRPSDRAPPPFQAGTGWMLAQIIDVQDGSEIARSPSLTAGESLLPLLAGVPLGVPVSVRLGDRRLRALRVESQRPFSAADPFAITVPVQGYFAIDATATMAELRRLALTLAGVWLTASLLALVAAWWLRRAVIGPLHRMSAAIAAIDAERMQGRVEVEAPQELAETIRLLNGLLDGLAAVLKREQGTIANIAHELRSPISGLRTTLEVAALTGDTAVAERCLPTVVAMQSMIANLLALARLETGHESMSWQEVDIATLVASCWADLEPIARARRQELERSGAGGRARTGAAQARMLLANLLDNALAYAPEGSPVRLEMACRDGRCWVSIGNRIAGPEPDPDRMFEPFWRGDHARSSPNHCGLGLALVRRLAVLMEADLRVEVTAGCCIVQVGFPAAL